MRVPVALLVLCAILLPASRILFIADDNGGKIYLAAVPESTTTVLIGFGLLALIGIRRLQSKRYNHSV